MAPTAPAPTVPMPGIVTVPTAAPARPSVPPPVTAPPPVPRIHFPTDWVLIDPLVFPASLFTTLTKTPFLIFSYSV